MNDELLQKVGVTFLPWEGTKYHIGLSGGRRLLVVGDSNKFTNGDPIQDSEWNRSLIKECQQGDGYNFYKRIHELLGEELAKFCTKTEDKYWIYDFISFYNYITSDQLKQGSGGQTAQMYYQSEPAMIAVLCELKPTHVLILGKKVWEYFLYKSLVGKFENLTGEAIMPNWEGVHMDFNKLWKYSLGNRTFLAAHVYHPSSWGNCSYSAQPTDMKNIISKFLNEKPF